MVDPFLNFGALLTVRAFLIGFVHIRHENQQRRPAQDLLGVSARCSGGLPCTGGISILHRLTIDNS